MKTMKTLLFSIAVLSVAIVWFYFLFTQLNQIEEKSQQARDLHPVEPVVQTADTQAHTEGHVLPKHIMEDVDSHMEEARKTIRAARKKLDAESELGELPPSPTGAHPPKKQSSASKVAPAEKLEAASPAVVDEDSDAGGKLWDWIKAEGGKFVGIELRQLSRTERGVYTSRDLAEGEMLISLPAHLVISTRDAVGLPLGKALLELGKAGKLPLGDFDGVMLTAWLIEQAAAGATSKWATYMASLPSSFPTMPFNFSEALLGRCVGGFQIENDVLKGQRILEDEFTKISAAPEAKALGLTKDKYLHARFCSFSRTFTVSKLRLEADALMSRGPTLPWLPETEIDGLTKMRGKDEASIFAPLADMINHARGGLVNCVWKYTATDGFVIRTRRALPKGTELFISYGDKENTIFFPYYGFVDTGNPNEKLTVSLDFARLAKEDGLPANTEVPEMVNLDLQLAKPATTNILEDVLKGCRAYATLQSKSADQDKAMAEVAAFKVLQRLIAIQEAEYRGAGDLPSVCTAYRGTWLELLAVWRSFATSALAVIAVSNEGTFKPDESLKVPQAVLQARLYFGVWFRLWGKRLVENDEAFEAAHEYGRVSFLDVIEDLTQSAWVPQT